MSPILGIGTSYRRVVYTVGYIERHAAGDKLMSGKIQLREAEKVVEAMA